MNGTSDDQPDEGSKRTILSAKRNALAQNVEDQQLARQRMAAVIAEHRHHRDCCAKLPEAERHVKQPALKGCVAEIMACRRELTTLQRTRAGIQREIVRDSLMTPEQLQARLPRCEPTTPGKNARAEAEAQRMTGNGK